MVGLTPSRSIPNPEVAAKEAGLRYCNDEHAGISRLKRGDSFQYRTSAGSRVTDPDTLSRIKRLAIPPAWQNVWIAPSEDCHLQATGRDARGRKQYRYHARWRETRDEAKFDRVLAFGRALPKIRRRVEKDLAQSGLPREKVLATVVKLLEATLIRVGNDEYARQNGSYGLTTMRNKHAKVQGSTISFEFRGKSGVRHKIEVTDRRLARVVAQCQDLPGQEIFAYLDDNGGWQDVKSEDVNAYLREIAGERFTAKDFRTWSGTVLAAMALQEFEKFTTNKEAKTNVVRAVENVAKLLGNTPTICRKCYVHPEVLESYLEGTTISTLRQRGGKTLAESVRSLKPEEAAVMALLQERLARTGAARNQRTPAGLKKALSESVKRLQPKPETAPAKRRARTSQSARAIRQKRK